MDKISLDRIELLHPKLRDEATTILSEIDEKVSTPNSFCRYAFTLRTFAEQQVIYNQGRTTPGAIVTRSKPGQSFHNFGTAIDIVFILDDKNASWDVKADWNKNGIADWMEIVEIFKKYGWDWGGDWKSFKDLPHFEKNFGNTWQQMLSKYDAKDFISGTTYINL